MGRKRDRLLSRNLASIAEKREKNLENIRKKGKKRRR